MVPGAFFCQTGAETEGQEQDGIGQYLLGCQLVFTQLGIKKNAQSL